MKALAKTIPCICVALVWSCTSAYSVGEGATPASDAGVAVGERGGACYPNATCNAGLVCIAGECELVIDGAVQPIDGSSNSAPDATSTTGIDAAAGPDGGACNATIIALTANDCGNGLLKCLAEQVCYQTPEQCVTEESDRGVSCNTSADCPTKGNSCCALLPNVNVNMCPIQAKPQADSSISTTCRVACAVGEYAICTATAQCGTKRCTAARAPGAFLTGQIVNFAVCL